MNSIDIKSLLIGALFTAVVFLSTGWQRSVVSGTQKVEIVKWPNSRILPIFIDAARNHSLPYQIASKLISPTAVVNYPVA